eukprot:scaffold43322_cov28-Tisochrysis_lutea.AAC.11
MASRTSSSTRAPRRHNLSTRVARRNCPPNVLMVSRSNSELAHAMGRPLAGGRAEGVSDPPPARSRQSSRNFSRKLLIAAGGASTTPDSATARPRRSRRRVSTTAPRSNAKSNVGRCKSAERGERKTCEQVGRRSTLSWIVRCTALR